MSIKLLAYYLPQYHPTPENNRWWGKGFTEWTNVTKAKPFYNGHQQPKFPADLGYYDLRVAEVRKAQADMAREYGVSGFCYYHYWFGKGIQTLNRPIDELIASGEPDFPFCFCWANQSWTGHWFGADRKMLLEQVYPGDEDIEAHFNYLLKAFNDKRYIRIDDKPVLKILDIRHLPDPAYMAKKLKELALKNGLKGLYLIGGNFVPENWNPLDHNFDALADNSFSRSLTQAMVKKTTYIKRLFFNNYTKQIFKGSFFKNRKTVTMKQFMEFFKISSGPYPIYPIVLPNWDTTPRSLAKGTVITNCAPQYFAQQLEIAAEHFKTNNGTPIIFIKSWNEWAEGNILEPDTKMGYKYLEVVKSFVDQFK